MRASRTAGRLLRCYPPGWRARYGEELEALVVDMSDGGPVSWRTRADVIWAGGRERLRSAGVAGDGSPDAGARAGASLVLWAWAVFVFAGATVAKTSEHWQQALPSGGHGLANVAFDVLAGGAVVASASVLIGIAVAGPGLLGLMRDGGWPGIQRRIRAAGVATLVLVAATVGLKLWAGALSAHQRAGADTVYAVAFTGWALLGLRALLAWTGAAVRTERQLQLRDRPLRAQVRLATLVATAMTAMTAATAVWWVAVAQRAPAALTGSRGAHVSPAVPQLVLAITLMLIATGLAGIGARRATRYLPALSVR
jgi:hypothetical protein